MPQMVILLFGNLDIQYKQISQLFLVTGILRCGFREKCDICTSAICPFCTLAVSEALTAQALFGVIVTVVSLL